MTKGHCPQFSIDHTKAGVSCLIVYIASFGQGNKLYYNYLVIIGPYDASSFTQRYDPMKTADALAIDLKIDDGAPSTGKMISELYDANTVGNCVASPTSYDLADTSNYPCSTFIEVGAINGSR